jgi:predicted nucleic acid-binding protein
VIPATAGPDSRGSRSRRVRDAIHAAVMLTNGISKIATFDAGFERIPGVRRAKLD